jgi:hypothetical protein
MNRLPNQCVCDAELPGIFDSDGCSNFSTEG